MQSKVHSLPVSKPQQPIRVVIADRNRMSSQLLAESLSRDPRFEPLPAGAKSDVISVAVARRPDVVVISIDPEGRTADNNAKQRLQLVRGMKARVPDSNILVLLEAPEKELVIAAFRAGAAGVFSRTEPLADFHICIERVSRGELCARGVEAQFLLDSLQNTPTYDNLASPKLASLSRREFDVAELVSRGQTNKQVAERLGLSEHTIKNYLFRIFEKAGVTNRFELGFLLSRKAGGDAPKTTAWSAAQYEDGFEAHLAAAQQGSVIAQYVVGISYLHGRGVDHNEAAAYYWLRVAERNAAHLQEESRMAVAALKPDTSQDYRYETASDGQDEVVSVREILQRYQTTELGPRLAKTG